MSLLIPPTINYKGPRDNYDMYVRRGLSMLEIARWYHNKDINYRVFEQKFHDGAEIRIQTFDGFIHQDIINIKAPIKMKEDLILNYREEILIALEYTDRTPGTISYTGQGVSVGAISEGKFIREVNVPWKESADLFFPYQNPWAAGVVERYNFYKNCQGEATHIIRMSKTEKFEIDQLEEVIYSFNC